MLFPIYFMPNFIMSNDGNDMLEMILGWEKTQPAMREEDNRLARSRMLIDGGQFVFFFVCRGGIYGANENARAVFSVMKNPMDELGYQDMSFSAVNMAKAFKGVPGEEVFVYKDLKDIKVVNREEARKILLKAPSKKSAKDSQ